MSGHLVITGTSDDARARGYRNPALGGWYRSILPESQPDIGRVEFVAGPDCYMLQPTLEARPADMNPLQWTYSGVGTSSDWGTVISTAAPWKRLQFFRSTANEAPSYATCGTHFLPEPGVWFDLAFGAPALGQTKSSYVGFGMLVNGVMWWELRCYREPARQIAAGDTLARDRVSLVVWRSGSPKDGGCTEKFAAEPGTTLGLRARIISSAGDQWLNLAGPRLSRQIAIRLPKALHPELAQVRLAVNGGTATFLVAWCAYALNPISNFYDGYVEEAETPAVPVNCSPTLYNVYGHTRKGSKGSLSASISPLRVTLQGGPGYSPQLAAVSCQHSPVLVAATTSSAALPDITRCELRLVRRGAGISCGLWFVPGTDITAYTPMQVVDVDAQWDDDAAPYNLFRGIIGDPRQVAKEQGLNEVPQLGITGDALRLQKTFCTFTEGYWGGRYLSEFLAYMLNEAGINAATRLTIDAALTGAYLMADDAQSLRFGKGTTVEQAISDGCRAANAEWCQDLLGVIQVLPRKTYTAGDTISLEIDETLATLKTLDRRYEAITDAGGNYANTVYCEDSKTKAYALYSNAAAVILDGGPLQMQVSAEFNDPAVEARRRLSEALAEGRQFGLKKAWDFAKPVWPGDWAKVIHATSVGVTTNDIYRVEEVRLSLSCATEQSKADTAEAEYRLSFVQAGGA